MLYTTFGKNPLHCFSGDVVWRCWWMDGWRTPAYTVSSPMSLRLRWAKNQTVTPEKLDVIILKFEQLQFYPTVMCPNDAGGMANSVVPDQTHPCLHYSVWKLGIITVFQSLCSFKMAYYLYFLHLTLCGFSVQLHLLLKFYRKEFHWVCGVTLSWNL